MVEKSVRSSSKKTTPLEITTSQALTSRPMARNLKACGRKGAFPSKTADGDLADDLYDISDAEVAGHLNTKKESLLMKIAWELMNSEYQKGKQRKPTTGKKKDSISKTAPSKKTSATRNQSNAESENKKRPSLDINFDILDKLLDDESSPKRAKLVEPVIVGEKMEKSLQSSEECLLEPQGSEEEKEEAEDCNEDYGNEDAYGGVEEFYGDADLEFEDQGEGEDNEDIIW